MESRLVIKFPFQSVNEEQYILALHTQKSGAITNVLNAMDADTECFKYIEDHIDGKFNVYEYEGTLCGSVKAEDDDREDLFEPLCTSKLKFAIACQQFPTWLMALCDQAQSVSVGCLGVMLARNGIYLATPSSSTAVSGQAMRLSTTVMLSVLASR